MYLFTYLCSKDMTITEIRNKLKDKTVGIAGCGGLGSNCAIALARTGIGRLVIADFDKVELSNLNRQYFFHDQIGMFKANALRDIIKKIDDGVVVETHVLSLGPASIVELFADCDVIVEAFDIDSAKHMIIETVLSEMPKKYIVSGQGLAGYGNNELLTTQRFGQLYVVGDGQTAVCSEQPPLAPRVGAVANMQANIVLEILLNED
jgi:sulfur carrier protein ThiS adenylyltransferase